MGGREFTGPRAAISLSDSVVHNVLNDLERKHVDWAPSSLGPIHCRPDFVLHIRCYDAATKRLGRLTLCYCFQLTIVARRAKRGSIARFALTVLTSLWRTISGSFSSRCLHFKRCLASFRAFKLSASLSFCSRNSLERAQVARPEDTYSFSRVSPSRAGSQSPVSAYP